MVFALVSPRTADKEKMSGWTLDTEEQGVQVLSGENNRHGTKASDGGSRSKSRKAFFPDEGDDDARAGSVDVRQDSLTLASARAISRRSQRGTTMELVVDDSDESSSPVEDQPKRHASTTIDPPHVEGPKKSAKNDQVSMAEVVQPPGASGTLGTQIDAYVHGLVREFLQNRFPPQVLVAFDKELPLLPSAHINQQQTDAIHQRLVSSSDASKCGATRIEQVVVTWDTKVHRRRIATSSPSSSSSSKASSKASKKKPQLTVSVAVEPTPSAEDEGDYNRLNHPGHTPKAQQSELLAAVIGKPGSTPRASVSELRALGFDDIGDPAPATQGPASLLRVRHVESDGGEENDLHEDDEDDDQGDGLSNYAERKRAAGRHHKHVSIGEAGRTPTKEYIFFRETPPRFVTETVDAAADVLRSLGLSTDSTRPYTPPQRMEQFVELQSSDVAKYAVGLRVKNLGSQRNVTGIVSKIYGSRQCGTAGPGTIVIDTWDGRDVEPSVGECEGDDDDSSNDLGDEDF